MWIYWKLLFDQPSQNWKEGCLLACSPTGKKEEINCFQLSQSSGKTIKWNMNWYYKEMKRAENEFGSDKRKSCKLLAPRILKW